MFAVPSFRGSLIGQNEPQKGKHRGEKPQSDATALAMDFLAELPHAIHASVTADGASVWCSLRDDSLVTAAADIFLKHGVRLSGQWTIVGILDAQPEETTPITSGMAPVEFAAATTSTYESTDFPMMMITKGMGGLIDGITSTVRVFLGRPARSYGVTPLLILRQVG